MQLNIRPGQLEKILGKFKKADNNKSFFIKNPNYSWSLDLVKNYQEVVAHAMGSVEARGGYIHMTFLDTVSGREYWKNLAPLTILQQAMRKGHTITRNGRTPRNAAYDDYKWEFTIYKDTGLTKDAVTFFRRENYAFAGIPSSASEALKRADAQETGKTSDGRTIPQRRLFAVANDLFITAMHTQLRNREGWLYKNMAGQFVDFMDKVAGWGHGPTNYNPFIH